MLEYSLTKYRTKLACRLPRCMPRVRRRFGGAIRYVSKRWTSNPDAGQLAIVPRDALMMSAIPRT
jgi:hypothetical protein